MRKSTKRFLSAAMALSLAFSLSACGTKEKDNSSQPTQPVSNNTGVTTAPSDNTEGSGEVEKPKTLKVMIDGTVVTEANGRAQLEAALEAALGIDIVFNQPDHTGYYDVVSSTFASGDWPDIILLGSAYYATYASAGALADISSYWESSDLKSSGRFVNTAAIDALYTTGKNGETGLYGFSPARGNGCVTYIRKSWLDASGLPLPTNYQEYLELIKYFTEHDMDGSGDPSNTYGVTAAGIIAAEAPYTNYLPEFYQQAYPDFYQKDGVWVDGFSEDAFAEALERLQFAYQNGYIDKEALTNGTKDCRNKFYDNKVGVFTYWAGTWAGNLADNLAAANQDPELVILPPIAELGGYVERQAPVWCITTKCENPEGAWKYFLEPMLDGGELQSLWTYGVKGVHWDNIAETITWGDNSQDYQEGQFHFLPTLEKPDTLYTKSYIDPMLSLATFVGEAPGASMIKDIAADCAEKFNEWCTMAPVIVSNDVINANSGDLWDARTKVVTAVVTQNMSVADGMAMYQKEAGSIVSEILESLNK